MAKAKITNKVTVFRGLVRTEEEKGKRKENPEKAVTHTEGEMKEGDMAHLNSLNSRLADSDLNKQDIRQNWESSVSVLETMIPLL